MSIHHSPTEAGDPYYKCSDCDYTSPIDVGIGLCPTCGADISGSDALD